MSIATDPLAFANKVTLFIIQLYGISRSPDTPVPMTAPPPSIVYVMFADPSGYEEVAE